LNIPQLPIGDQFESVINWLTDNLGFFFDSIGVVVTGILEGLEYLLLLPHPLLMIALLTALAWWTAKRGVAIFTVLGMLLIFNMGYWAETMETLSLVLSSVFIALLIGLPLGISAAKSDKVERVVRPVLDFMQTLPAFVYLIPAVIFFGLGAVPGVIATLIFALPPVVRLTSLGIRQVPAEIYEAAISFGSNPRQLLFKAELPVALPTIMAGVNQTIMLALSMVVIAGMIGAGGLGNLVLKGIGQMDIALGFDAGISIVILAIFLDRVTQSLSHSRK
jgi:glycine betaine/proline transport system permease protein